MQNILELMSKHIHPTDVIMMLVIIACLFGLALYSRCFRKQPLKIIEHKNLFITFSGAVVALCVLAIIVRLASGGLNLSLEFTGGSMLELGFTDTSVTSDSISNVIREYSDSQQADAQLKAPVIQMEVKQKVISYSEPMHTVTMVLSSKKGALNASDIKGLKALFLDRFGKVKFLDDSFKEDNGKVSFSVLMEENTDTFKRVFADTSADEQTSLSPDEASKDVLDAAAKEKDEAAKDLPEKVTTPDQTRDSAKQDPPAPKAPKMKVVFNDEINIEAMLTSYSPDLAIEDISISFSEIPSIADDSFKAAIVRISKKDGNSLTNEELSSLLVQISDKLGNLYIFKKESIGPSIGKELASKALLAIIVALFLQLIYIAIRFNNKWYYGIAADIGLIHDLLVMVGIYVAFNHEFDSPFVAAMMTIIGYSVMNSIVIFDRIREDLVLFKSEPFPAIVNTSCNQTMTRSINTLLTVLITLFALYFFGGATLKNFAFALIIGCAAGGYSSIFLVTSFLVIFEEKIKDTEKSEASAKRQALEDAALERKRLRDLKNEMRKGSEEELPPESEDDLAEYRTKLKKSSEQSEEKKAPRRGVRRRRR